MTNNEASIENEIRAKGLNAPRLTPQHIDAAIAEEIYILPADAVVARGGQVTADSPLRCLTVCVLILRNGFTVVGTSACASPENFNVELGRKIAREKARDKIWVLEGYLLKDYLHARSHGHALEERSPLR